MNSRRHVVNAAPRFTSVAKSRGSMDGFDRFGDILGGLFGDRGQHGPHRGEDLLYTLELTLTEAYRGCTKMISFPREEFCGECRGSGARPGSQPVRCRQCNGRGAVVVSQ